MILDSEAQRVNLLRLLDRVQITGAEAEILVELKAAIRSAAIQPPAALTPVRPSVRQSADERVAAQ